MILFTCNRADTFIYTFPSIRDLSSGSWRQVGGMSEAKGTFAMGVITLSNGNTVAIMTGGTDGGPPYKHRVMYWV